MGQRCIYSAIYQLSPYVHTSMAGRVSYRTYQDRQSQPKGVRVRQWDGGFVSRWESPATVLFLRPKCFSLQDPNSSLSNRINASVSQSVHSAGRFRTVRSLVTSFFFPLLSFSFECGLWSLVPSAFLLDLTPTYIHTRCCYTLKDPGPLGPLIRGRPSMA